MNKPATATTARVTRWAETAHWYLWDGGFLLVGRGEGVVPPHSHHAIQVGIVIDGEVELQDESGNWRRGRGFIVRADAVHSYKPNGSLGAMIFVDPESAEGAWLGSSLRDEITPVPEARREACVRELKRHLDQPFESMGIPELIKHCVQALSPGVPPSRRLDERVTRVLASIRGSNELRISIDDAAAMACLSPSRFAHLFKQQVGLPFRRYMLWRKLTRAMLVIGRGQTISTAAHEADFSDAAHLTRTFYQMVGLAPSLLMRGQFFEIAPPFEVPDTGLPNR
ncbi:MAG: AraC family transcriptional regulator [Acidobacteriota bacterium]|nr:AraC family transcriptional regulator [Acidobacteriota bacterium]